MANQEYVKLLRQDVIKWNEWREKHQDIRPDLSGVDLREANLSSVDLREADLTDANLNNANLIRATLNDANLNNANLSHANLGDANLRNANLSSTQLNYASLVSANLRNANLSHANLVGALLIAANLSFANLNGCGLFYANLSKALLKNTNLYGVQLWHTVFNAVDLRSVEGLTEIEHREPSAVALSSIKLPPDGSALHFLRGAGVPDEWIDDYRARMMHPIQYHSCFISYSSQDETPAYRLYADLQTHNVRCWFALEDMKIGNKFRQRIDEAIHLQDKLLLLLSEHSIASTWVENEVEAALEKEDREQREVLFPIRLDDAVMQTSRAWAVTLRRTRHIGDFTTWTKPQAYQNAFDRLLRDLKRNIQRSNLT